MKIGLPDAVHGEPFGKAQDRLRANGINLFSSIMEELGFRAVYNMLGGITQWKAKGFPIIK